MAREPRNRHLQLRITQTGSDWITELADDTGIGNADVVRAALAYAAQDGFKFTRFLRQQDASLEEER